MGYSYHTGQERVFSLLVVSIPDAPAADFPLICCKQTDSKVESRKKSDLH